MKFLKNVPAPGMRILKTSLAVFICFLIAELRVRTFHQDALIFYSVIACIQAMQKDGESSFELAKSRIIGTLIGAAHGILMIFLLQNIPILLHLKAFIFSLMIIPLIMWTVILKIPSAAYICCVTFLSVTISHGSDISPYAFAFSRIIDTFIGLGVSLIINTIVPRKRQADN